MKFKRLILGLIPLGLLLLAPSALYAIGAAPVTIVNKASMKAIDTLTVYGNDGGISAATPVTRMVVDTADSGNTENQTRNRLVSKGTISLPPFTIESIAGRPDCYRIKAPSGGDIDSVKIKGQNIFPNGNGISRARQIHNFGCGPKAPGLGTFGLILLSVLIMGSAIWLIRKRLVKIT